MTVCCKNLLQFYTNLQVKSHFKSILKRKLHSQEEKETIQTREPQLISSLNDREIV